MDGTAQTGCNLHQGLEQNIPTNASDDSDLQCYSIPKKVEIKAYKLRFFLLVTAE
jgi:hypothetical protein